MAEKKNNEQQLYVQKEPFEYNGKMYNHYYIKGVVRGREVKIDLAPPNKDTDMGGYTVLDIVFGDADRADLIIEPFEIEDEKTKKVIKANRYIVRTVDEDGKVYECTVKPRARRTGRFLICCSRNNGGIGTFGNGACKENCKPHIPRNI